MFFRHQGDPHPARSKTSAPTSPFQGEGFYRHSPLPIRHSGERRNPGAAGSVHVALDTGLRRYDEQAVGIAPNHASSDDWMPAFAGMTL